MPLQAIQVFLGKALTMLVKGEQQATASDVLALNTREAAQALGISARTLWTHTKSGEIPHLCLGRRILYPVDALRDWMRRTVTKGDAARKQ